MSDIEAYEEVTFGKHDLPDLVNRSNDWFLEMKMKKLITEKAYNYFFYNFKKPSNLGKLYFLRTGSPSNFKLWYAYILKKKKK